MLRYVPFEQLERIRAAEADPAAGPPFADACRINTLYMIARAGSGHIGTGFSCMGILAWLHLEVLGEGTATSRARATTRRRCTRSCWGTGVLPFERIHGLRRVGGLPGHPDVAVTPEVGTS